MLSLLNLNLSLDLKYQDLKFAFRLSILIVTGRPITATSSSDSWNLKGALDVSDNVRE